ncbi:hypothetical protein [Bradyrhizobium sp. WSM3983]|uniref:hypothetical protein n=1 Tax=Bradyrhizobium sp. WSM3983 TaxID=1038867 RepID=UPI0012EC7B05|nr:hypothetical protein [Bradyrhizobium sp. WSM3983]
MVKTINTSVNSARAGVTAPVSHQKRPNRSATNAIELGRKDSNTNEADRYPAAHNRLIDGLRPAKHIGKSPRLILD